MERTGRNGRMKGPDTSWVEGRILATIRFEDGRVVTSWWEYSRHADGRLSFQTLPIPEGEHCYRALHFRFRPEETEPCPSGRAGRLVLRREVDERDGILMRSERW